jgi:hypothetical protein
MTTADLIGDQPAPEATEGATSPPAKSRKRKHLPLAAARSEVSALAAHEAPRRVIADRPAHFRRVAFWTGVLVASLSFWGLVTFGIAQLG